MSEWGVPDWRDASAYGAQPDWNVNRWRWEFLRRRNDLRDEFDEKCEAEFADTMKRFHETPEHFDGSPYRPDERGFHIFSRLIAPDCPLLQPLPNPRIGDQPYFAISWTDGVGTGAFYKREPPAGHLRVDFDLSKPIEPQLRAAKKLLLTSQVKHAGKAIQIRHHPDKWPTYLRVIDARADGASWSMVAGILPSTVSSTIETARAIHRQAEALCFNPWG